MSTLRIRGTDIVVSAALLKPWVPQLQNNHGDVPEELSAEALWLAAHGKPFVSNQISEASALEWVRSLLPKPKAAEAAPSAKAEGKK